MGSAAAPIAGEAKALTNSTPTTARGWIALLFGNDAAVDARTYLRVGIALMALKLAVEAAWFYFVDGVVATPALLLVPLMSVRANLLGGSAEQSVIAMAIWSLPFAWVGLSMSVRRAADAGLPPVLGLVFCVPVLNYALMALLATRPTRQAPSPAPTGMTDDGGARPSLVLAATRGVGVSVLVGAPVVALGAAVLGDYGAPLFLSSPFLMGAIAGWLAARDRPVGATRGAAIGALAICVAMALLLLFALEGVICLAMAAPVAIIAGAAGGSVGAAWARPLAPTTARLALLIPLFGLAAPSVPLERMVQSEVIVNAPPERVWPIVLAFPEIPADDADPWLFRAGVAMPLRARIQGVGVGAIRHCEFTTGAFVEPITAWEAPHRLAFDVTEQPSPMRELSPWKHVHAPHLVQSTLRSRRGEFRLEPRAGNRTRLIGRTWYTIAMGPEPYWALWVDAVVHDVHLRVLGHIAKVSTAGGGVAAAAAEKMP